ncbi:MAG: hypothetical protein E4G95_09510, partial [Bacteroidia bacterium]
MKYYLSINLLVLILLGSMQTMAQDKLIITRSSRNDISIDSVTGVIPAKISVRVTGAGEPTDNGKAEVNDSVEQLFHGTRAPAERTASFDGLGYGFSGPQGSARYRNPSDNSLAVGPDHIVQTVNSRMAIFTKKGWQFGESGRILYGPVETNNVFRGFGG